MSENSVISVRKQIFEDVQNFFFDYTGNDQFSIL